MNGRPSSIEVGGQQAVPSPPEDDLGGILRQARPRLRRVFQRFRISPEDAEDLLQNVLIQFLRKRDEINDADRWLVGAVRNECLGFLRTQRRRLYDAVDSALLDLAPDPSPSTGDQQTTRLALEGILKRVRPRCRALLNARYLMGYTLAETAERVGCRLSSVDQLVRRCVSGLSAMFGPRASDPPRLSAAQARSGPS